MKTPPQSPSEGLASARHELPTHLQVEDRLIAGLTIRQTLLLSAGVSLGYSLWRHLAGMQASLQTALAPMQLTGLTALVALATRLALAALPVGVFALLALARLADRPLEEWLVLALRYLTLPKAFIWRSIGATGVGAGAISASARSGRMAPTYLDTGLQEDEDGDEEGADDEEGRPSPGASVQTGATLQSPVRGEHQR